MTTFQSRSGFGVDLANRERRQIFSNGITVTLPCFVDDVSAIENGATIVDVRGQMDTISIYGSAARNNTASQATLFPSSVKTPVEPTPLRLRWLLLGGNQCVVDPTNILAAATTVFTSYDDMKSRAGLIIRLSGFHADRIVLIGYKALHSSTSGGGVSDSTAQITLNVSGEADLRGAHRLQVEVGNYTS